jgi:NADH-quinone oxidoreductase subunit C
LSPEDKKPGGPSDGAVDGKTPDGAKPEAKPAAGEVKSPGAAKPAVPPGPAPAKPAIAKPATPPKPKPPKLEEVLAKPVSNAALDALKEQFPDAVENVAYHAGQVSVTVPAARIVEICGFLKNDSRTQMKLLSDLCGVDYPQEEKRFEIVYNLYSISLKQIIRIKARVADGESIDTVTTVWATANWHEREAFDLFGIKFSGHPNLTRILLPDDWKGHPLRKEYPLEGFPEQHPRFR